MHQIRKDKKNTKKYMQKIKNILYFLLLLFFDIVLC